MSELPDSPISPLLEASINMHEHKINLVAAGFTNEEAMQIVCAMLMAIIAKPAGES